MEFTLPDSDLTRRRFVVSAGAAGAVLAVGLPGTGAAPAHAAHAETGTARTSGYAPEDFADPRRDSRPTVYWYWNGTVTPELVENQMADLRSKGMYEVILFPFDNAEMQPVFFTEDWFAVVGHVLRIAERTGMRVWIFNDDHFPSGRAGEYIVKGGTVGSRTYEPRPDLRLKALWRSTTVVEGPASADLTATTGVGVDTGRLVADADVLGGAAVLSRGAGWTDCTVTGSAKAEHGAAGLVVRASPTGTDGYAVEFDQTGVVTVLRLTDGAAPAELARSSRTDGFNRTKYHTLAVTVRGDSIGVTLDGKDKGTVTDARHTTGSVGVRAVDGQRALWESLTVTAADGTTLYEEAFDAAAVAGDFPARPRPEGTAAPVAAAARPVGATGTEHLVELTDDLRAGRAWQVPAGRWQIDVFGGSALIDDSQGYSRSYVDLLDDEPVDLFLDMIPGSTTAASAATSATLSRASGTTSRTSPPPRPTSSACPGPRRSRTRCAPSASHPAPRTPAPSTTSAATAGSPADGTGRPCPTASPSTSGSSPAGTSSGTSPSSPTPCTTRRHRPSASPPPATCTRSTSGPRSPAVTSSPPSTSPANPR